MGVDGDLLGGLTPEELQIGRVVAYHFGPTSAADMTVQAEHRVGGGHHHVQVVRDHQHRAAVSCAYRADQRIELGLPGDVHALHGFVEQQQLGVAQQRARQQQTLQFTAGDRCDRCLQQALNPHLGCHLVHTCHVALCHLQETTRRKRQRGIDLQLLRHVADAQPLAPPDTAGGRLCEADQDLQQSGLARAVRADQREDLFLVQAQRNVFKNGLRTGTIRDISGFQQKRTAHAYARDAPGARSRGKGWIVVAGD